ncbi:MAG: hypothetical protein HXY20_02110 [Acidobacteria bacterium]|nr:hypothetical protein [Acidobacteriota bacterium]
MTDETDDLTADMIASSKRKMRLNALILAAVFLLLTVAPHPWAVLAPLLFLLPVLYTAFEKLRRRASGQGGSWESQGAGAEHGEPYSSIPRDNRDPRRYRPIE